MEKRSRRRIRDLVALAAFQGLDANESGCARISMMARELKPLRSTGRIQMRQTNYLQIVKSGLHRTAGPYKRAIRDRTAANRALFDHLPRQLVLWSADATNRVA